jgi:hypothetical protein
MADAVADQDQKPWDLYSSQKPWDLYGSPPPESIDQEDAVLSPPADAAPAPAPTPAPPSRESSLGQNMFAPTGYMLPADPQQALKDFGTGALTAAGATPENLQGARDALIAKLPDSMQEAAKIGTAIPLAIDKTIMGVADWASSQSGQAQLLTAGIPVAKIPMAIKFFHDMAKGSGESSSQMVDAFQKGDYQGFADSLVATAGNVLGAGALGVHGVSSALKGGELPDASKIKGATPVGEQPGGTQGAGRSGGQGVGSGEQGTQAAGTGEAAQPTEPEVPLKLNHSEIDGYGREQVQAIVDKHGVTWEQAANALAKARKEAGLSKDVMRDPRVPPTGKEIEDHIGATYDGRFQVGEGAKGLHQFTWRQADAKEGDPHYGATFYVPEGASLEQAMAKAKSKAAEFGTPDYSPGPKRSPATSAEGTTKNAPGATQEPKPPVQSHPFSVVSDEATGEHHVVNEKGEVVETHDNPNGAHTSAAVYNQLNEAPPKSQPFLDPDDQKHFDAELGNLQKGGVPVELTDDAGTTHPFAQDAMAWIDRKTGKIYVNKDSLKYFVNRLPKKDRASAIRSVLAEERIHLATDDAAAATYWKNLSPWEQAILKRRYTHGFDLKMNDINWGHEALRYRIQQLARMKPTEVALAVGKEKWTLKALTVAEHAIRGARSVINFKSSRESTAILKRIQQNIDTAKLAIRGVSPAALGRGRPAVRPESEEQEQFILPESESTRLAGSTIAASNKPGQEGAELPKVPEGERAKAAEAIEKHRPPTLTYQQIRDVSDKWFKDEFGKVSEAINRGEHVQPSFKEFAKYIGQNAYGIKPGHLQEMWQDSVAHFLTTAKDDDIRALTKSVLVPKATKVADVEHAPGELGGIKGGGRGEQKSGSIWQAMANKPLSFDKKEVAGTPIKQTDFAGLSSVDMNAAVKKQKNENLASRRQEDKEETAIKRRRQILVSAIYKKLVVPKIETADLHRDDIKVDDIRFGGGKTTSAVQDFTDADASDPRALTAQLLDDAKRSSDDPTTYTKRLTLIQDRANGDVSLVSTYRRGEEAMLRDPHHPQKFHLPLQDMLRRYRVVQSILLDEPVQNFKKSWKTLQEYQDDFGAEAKRVNDAHTSGSGSVEEADQFINGRRVTQQTGENEGIPGSGVEEGESGHLQGPFRKGIEAETGAGSSSLDKSLGKDITPAEQEAVFKHIQDSIGHVPRTPDEVERALYEMTKDQPSAAAMSALRKAAAKLPDEPVKDQLKRLANLIYENKTDEADTATKAAKAAYSGQDAGAGRQPEQPASQDQSQGAQRGAAQPVDVTKPPEATTINKPVQQLGKEDWKALTRQARVESRNKEIAAKKEDQLRNDKAEIRRLVEAGGDDNIAAASKIIAKLRQQLDVSPASFNPRPEPKEPDKGFRDTIEEIWKKYSPMPAEGTDAYERGTSEARSMGWTPGDFDHFEDAVFNFAAMPTEKWPMSSKNKAALLKYYADNKGTGHDRLHLIDQNLSANHHLIDQESNELKEWESMQDFSKGAKKQPGVSDGINKEVQVLRNSLQSLHDGQRQAMLTRRLLTDPNSSASAPMAFFRRSLETKRDETTEKLGVLKRRAAMAFKQQPTKAHMAATIDGLDTTGNNMGQNAEWSVRMESANAEGKTFGFKPNFRGKKDVLESAPAFLSAGGVKTIYNYDPKALAEKARLLREDPLFQQWALKIRSMLGGPMRKDIPYAQKQLGAALEKRLIEDGFLHHKDAQYVYSNEAKSQLDKFMFQVRQGDEAADRMAKDGNAWDKFRARAWKKGNAKLMHSLEYAKAQWDHPEVRATARRMKMEMDRQFDMERDNGYNISYDENYLPGRYDGETWQPGGMLFGGTRILGKQFRAAKAFKNMYEAAAVGPYIPASMDGASLVGSRVRQGMRSVARRMWWDGLKEVKDENGNMVAKEGKMVNGKLSAPGREYVRFQAPGDKAIFIHQDYEGLVHDLVDPDALSHNVLSRGTIEAGQFLKHTVLLGDFFHLGRIAYYGASIMGRSAKFKPGWAATAIREADLDRAVDAGVIGAKTRDYLKEKIPFRIGPKADMISRSQLSEMYERSGLNTGQIQDAIYKDLARQMPGFGTYNRFLFDRFTTGMMKNAALTEFDRLSKLDPEKDSRQIVQESAKALNFYFGSIGRQGWFKSQTWQSIMRLAFLAPQWVEGLVKKEAQPLKLLTSPRAALTGRDTAFRGLAKGMASMLVMTQVINLINRGQPTWMNPEPDHKWDADLGNNVWLSPLAVFNELTSDIIRISETKQRKWDAIQQVGSNKLGFYGRAAMVLATGNSPTGEYQSTTAGVLGKAAQQLAPSPISFGIFGQMAGHAIAPGMVPPVTGQQFEQKAFSTMGVKTHIGRDPVQTIAQAAAQFKQEHGTQEPRIQFTDEATNSKIRYQLKMGDEGGALKTLNALKKTHNGGEIIDSMEKWARRPFTSSQNEQLFVAGMDDYGRKVYQQAIQQRYDEVSQFLDFYRRNNQ